MWSSLLQCPTNVASLQFPWDLLQAKRDSSHDLWVDIELSAERKACAHPGDCHHHERPLYLTAAYEHYQHHAHMAVWVPEAMLRLSDALGGILLESHSVFGTAGGLAGAFFLVPGLPFTRFWVGTLHM